VALAYLRDHCMAVNVLNISLPCILQIVWLRTKFAWFMADTARNKKTVALPRDTWGKIFIVGLVKELRE
jgi:hypothetical protein